MFQTRHTGFVKNPYELAMNIIKRIMNRNKHSMNMNMLFIAIVLFSTPIMLTGCKSDQDKISTHMEKGSDYFASEQYSKADIEFKNIVQIDPGYEEAWLFLGKTAMKLAKGREAFQAYSKVEEINPKNIEALIKLAGFFLIGKQIDTAKEKIETILSIDSNHINALFLKAQILAQDQKYSDAALLLEKIIAHDPTHVNAIQTLAKIQFAQKQFDPAEELLINAASIDEKALQPGITLVLFYTGQKKFNKAEAHLLKMAENNPANEKIQILLGNFYFRMRNEKNTNTDSLEKAETDYLKKAETDYLKKAETAYLKAAELTPDSIGPYMTLAAFYDQIANKPKALELYEKSISLEPENISIQLAAARFQFRNREVEDAEKRIDAILESRPTFYQGKMLKSEMLVFQKKFPEALKMLSSLEKDEPNDVRVHYYRALTHIGLGKNDQAGLAAARAIELKPEYTKARLLLADIHYQNRSFDLALAEAQKVLAAEPLNYRAKMIAGNACLNSDKHSEAEKRFNELIEIQPDNPAAYYRLAILKSDQKKYIEAEELLNSALSKNRMLMDVFTLLVRNSVVQKKFTQAHELCRQQLILMKSTPGIQGIIHNLQGGIYLQQRDIEKARAAFYRAIKVNPDMIKPYHFLARIFLGEKDTAKAIEQYQTILEKQPKMPMPHMMLGTIYEQGKAYDKAEEHYRKALEINPDYAPAANNLAYHLAERTDKFDEALKYARKAKEKLPNDPGVMDTLGLVYYKKGLFGNAVSELLDSLKQLPENPVIHYHLGLAYHGKGNRDLAVKELERALKLNSAFEGAGNAKQLLSELK